MTEINEIKGEILCMRFINDKSSKQQHKQITFNSLSRTFEASLQLSTLVSEVQGDTINVLTAH